MNRLVKWVILGMLAAILIAGAGLGFWWRDHLAQLQEFHSLPLQSVDLSRVEDGYYVGSFGHSRTIVEVGVQVEGHLITSVEVNNNRQTERSRSAEQVVAQVISQQSLDVDLVTGATTTSKVILKAIEQALNRDE